eukprot:m.31937 g.31937  ORF g.31937 m.31937 type:complete len:238 (+) comp10809_c0_seq2:50-763(+)
MAFALRALRPALRRAATAVVQQPLKLALPAALVRNTLQPARSFHSSMVAASAKADLLQAFAAELKDERENGAMEPLPNSFEDFQISTTAGSPKIEMVRTMGKHKVVVSINLNDCPMTEEEGAEEGSAEEKELGPATPQPNFRVAVAQGDKSLVFDVSSYMGELQLHRVSLQGKGAADEESYFCDAEFLDEGLFESLVSYLGECGINEGFCEFVEGFVADKEYEEYVNWLQKVPAFLK